MEYMILVSFIIFLFSYCLLSSCFCNLIKQGEIRACVVNRTVMQEWHCIYVLFRVILRVSVNGDINVHYFGIKETSRGSDNTSKSGIDKTLCTCIHITYITKVSWYMVV